MKKLGLLFVLCGLFFCITGCDEKVQTNTPLTTSQTENTHTEKTQTETSQQESSLTKNTVEDHFQQHSQITNNSKRFDSVEFEFSEDTLKYFSYTHLLSDSEFADLKSLLTTSAQYLDEVPVSTQMLQDIFGDNYDLINTNCYSCNEQVQHGCCKEHLAFLAYQYHHRIFGKETSEAVDVDTQKTSDIPTPRFFLINTQLGITGHREAFLGYIFTIKHTLNNEKINLQIEDDFLSQNNINLNHFNIPDTLTLFGETYTLHIPTAYDSIGGDTDFLDRLYASKEDVEQDITQHIKQTQKFQKNYLISFKDYPGVFFEYDNHHLFDKDAYNKYVGIYYSTDPITTDKDHNVTDVELTQTLTCYFGIQKTDANCSFDEVIPLYNYVNHGDRKYGIVQSPHYEFPYECYNQDETIDSCKYQLTQKNLPLYKLIPSIEDHYYILQPANGVVWEETTDGLGKPAVYVYDPEQRQNSLTVQLAEGAQFTHLEPYFSKGTTWNFISDNNSNIKVGNQVYPYLYYSSTAPNYQHTWTGRFVAGEDVDFFLNTKLDAMNFNEKEKSDFLEYRLPRFKSTNVYFIRFKFNEELDPYAKLIFKEQPDQVYRMFMEVLELNESTPLTFSKEHPDEHNDEYLQPFNRKGGFEVLERGAWFTPMK